MNENPEYSLTTLLPLPTVPGWCLVMSPEDTRRFNPVEVLPVVVRMAEHANSLKPRPFAQWSLPVRIHRKGSGRLPAFVIATKFAQNSVGKIGLIWIGSRKELREYRRERWRSFGSVAEYRFNPNWQAMN